MDRSYHGLTGISSAPEFPCCCLFYLGSSFDYHVAGMRSAVGSASDSRAIGHGPSQESRVRYPVRPHTFVSPSADSRRAVVSYWRKHVHEVLTNRLGGLGSPRKSVVRLNDHGCYRRRKTIAQQHNYHVFEILHL